VGPQYGTGDEIFEIVPRVVENLCIPALAQHLVGHSPLSETHSIQDVHDVPEFGAIPMSM
jgi:hypothetical protein